MERDGFRTTGPHRRPLQSPDAANGPNASAAPGTGDSRPTARRAATTALAATALALLLAVEAWAAVISVRPPVTLPIVYGVAVDPAHGGTVYATVQDSFDPVWAPIGSKVFRTTDGGATWVEVGAGLMRMATLFGIAVTVDSTVFVLSSGDGVHRSTDGGVTWSPSLGAGGHGIVADPAAAGTVYVYSLNGIARTADAGDSWTDIGRGLALPGPGDPAGPGVGCLAVDPHDHGVLYAGVHERGVYKSVDGGASWQSLDIGVHPSAVLALAIDPGRPQVVYAGTAEDGLFKSTDGGGHWTAVTTGKRNPQIHALAVDADSTVYAGIYDCCVLKSSDGGATWTDANPALHDHDAYFKILAADLSRPGTIYAGCW